MPPLTTLTVTCPYCGEPGELLVEEIDGVQEYVEDCAVCCRPWQVRVRVDARGGVEVELRRDDDA
jgi:hypothetical protein